MRRPPSTLTTTIFAAFLGLTLATVAGAQELNDEISALVAKAKLGAAKISIAVYDMEADRLIGEYDADRALIPASNMKLITSGAAIEAFGAEHVFRTELRLDRTARRLVVVGSGDPAFGDPSLLREMNISADALVDIWAEAVAGLGVTALDEVVVDDRVFDRDWVHPTWPTDQLNRWYCAGVGGVNFHANTLWVYARPDSQTGAPPRLTTEPTMPFVDLRNAAKTVNGKKQNTIWAAREIGTNKITIYGDVRWEAEPVRVALHDPGTTFGELLASRLRRAGVQVGSVRLAGADERLAPGELVHLVQTRLDTVLARCNVDSYNLYAEALLKAMGHKVTGAPGSWANGSAVVRMILNDRLGPAAGAGVVVADGSGMSRDNQISADLMCAWIDEIVEDPATGPAFLESLPRVGEGTLEKRFRRGQPLNEVRAKTGTLRDVSGLSGVVIHPTTGRKVAFSVLVNEWPSGVATTWVRQFQEDVALLADEWLTEEAGETVNFGG